MKTICMIFTSRRRINNREHYILFNKMMLIKFKILTYFIEYTSLRETLTLYSHRCSMRAFLEL